MFLGRVDMATRIVRKDYSGVKLEFANAYTSDPKGASNSSEFGKMRLLFKTDKGFIGIHSTGNQGFSKPYPDPFVLGSAIIDHLPKMNAIEAGKILRANGLKGNFRSLTLRKPLYPGSKHLCTSSI